MRASGSGPLGVIFMIAPLVAVPVLAIVGIPQFAPVVASPSGDMEPADFGEPQQQESGIGESARHANDDLFAPLSGDETRMTPLEDHVPARDRSRIASDSRFDGDNGSPQRGRGRRASQSRDSWDGPSEALSGWNVKTLAHDSDEAEPAPRGEADDLPEPRAPSRSNRSRQNPSRAAANRTEREPQFARQTSETNADTNEVALGNPFDGTTDEPKVARNSRSNRRNPDDVADEAPRSRNALRENDARDDPPRNARPAKPPAQTLPSAIRRVNTLGATKHFLTYLKEHDTFLFCCSFPSDDESRQPKRFEAEANEPLLAVVEVLKQIEEWQAAP